MHKTKVSVRHETDQKPRKPPERKRYLNVIYFIDSKRTRTLKFGIGTSYFTVGAISLAVIWSIVATGLLVRDRFVIAEMGSHSQSLLDTVFNYQTRYDEVYEKAYPLGEVEAPAIAEDEPAEDDEAPIKLAAADPKARKSADAEPSPSVLPVHKAAIAKDKGNIEKVIEGVPIGIDNFASTLLGKNLTVRLSLKNLVSPEKTSGSISGTVKFVDINNQEHTVTGRPSRSADDEEHFTIRYFTNKNLIFESPNGLAGKFVSVTIKIKADDGETKDFTYSVNKEIPAAAPPPVPIAKAIPEPPTISRTEEVPTIPAVPVIEKATTPETTDSIEATTDGGSPETAPESID